MKLIRFGEPGREKPGVELLNGKRIDTSAFGEDYDEKFLGSDGIARLKAWLKEHAGECSAIGEETRLGAPICRPSKMY